MTTETPESTDRFMVVGFDLGHAETAVATVWADSGEDPSIATLHIRAEDSQVHPTAVARYIDREGSEPLTIVGGLCFDLLEERIPDIPDSVDPGPDTASRKDVHLAFKSQDISPGSRAGYATELFVTQVIRQLTEPDPRSEVPERFIAIPPGTPVRWVFGVPSGWSTDTCKAYEGLLRRVVTSLHPSHDVEVIPESRAAMLYSRSLRSTPRGGAVAQATDLGSVLVIDMGSLTTDYTYLAKYPGANLREVRLDEDSAQLGAALIDRELMRRTIERSPARDVLDQTVRDNYQHARLEFSCRQAKERYFSRPATKPAPDDIALAHTRIMTSTGERILVPVPVPSGLMEEILSTPIEMPPANAMRSWQETFGGELAAVRTKILEQYGELPQTVLLTGGASRMPFAGDMCRAAFGIEADDGRGRRVECGAEPQYAIARGLAIAGRTQHRVDRFRAEADTFTHSRVPALIKENLEPLATALGEIMFSGLVEEQLCPAIARWRNGEFELLTEIAPEVLRARKEYLDGPEGSAGRDEVIRAWYDQITEVINQEAQLVANKYEVPSGRFRIRPLNSLEANPNADIDVTAGLAALRIIANTAATIMTLVTTYLTAVIIAVAAEAAAAAAAAAGVASAATPAGVVVVPVMAAGAVIGGIWGGKGAIMRRAMKKKIPPRMRKIGTEEYILRKVRKRAAADQLEAKGAQTFSAKFVAEGGEQIVADMSARVEKQLAKAAKLAALIIERGDI